jgi:ribosomal protein S18 acetylase RimI-like enzyme
MHIDIDEEPQLDAQEFLALVQRVWPGDFDPAGVEKALARTVNLTARASGRLVGSLRLLTDGYFFSTVTELLVDPEFRRRGIGRALLEAAWDRSPSSLAFGVQLGNEGFFLRCGFEPGLPGFERRKPRGAAVGLARRRLDLAGR